MLPIERVARTKLALADRMATSRLPKPYTVPFAYAPAAQPYATSATTDFYTMDMKQAPVEILPGYQTNIWGYDGMTPGPTIRVDQGRRVAIRHCNLLPKTHPVQLYDVHTSVHLHGSASLPQYDGYASDITGPLQFKDYHYPNYQDGRTLWYHDHGVHYTANNAYMGLAAMYIMHDPDERALGIPQDDYDVPLIVRDALFTGNGQLLYDDNSESGVYGDVILVNGRPWPIMDVEPRKYRFRILNASISRSYRWQLAGGEPLTVIGTDGGLMPTAQTVGDFRHAPAERYEVVIDFAKYAGTTVELKNLRPPNNRDFDGTDKVMAFRVGKNVKSYANNSIPAVLNKNRDVMDLRPEQAGVTRNFKFERQNGHWTINGETWGEVINSDYKRVVANPKVGDIEIWELENPGGGWFHPVHIHLIDFKILDRNGKPPMPHELGPKDVAYVAENEKVRVIMKFDDTRNRVKDPGGELPARTGRYMMHCHNLAHEDHDMMVQFEVGAEGPDPRLAAKCQDMPSATHVDLPQLAEDDC